jgi:hypothetical protein
MAPVPVTNAGDLSQEVSVLRWLTAEETLEMPQKIEEVNEIMLAKRLRSEDSMFVFFYDEDDIFAQRLLKNLEVLDDSLDKRDVDFVKISDMGIEKDYSLETLPALVHFNSGEPTVFQGDLRYLTFFKTVKRSDGGNFRNDGNILLLHVLS